MNGFAIGDGHIHANDDIQDQRDAESLIDVLENQIVKIFYERDTDDLPQHWITRMKHSVKTLGWRYNADRMVMDYVTGTYIPAAGGESAEMRMMP